MEAVPACGTRACWIPRLRFIVLNGGRLQADDLELYPVYLGLAEGSLSEADCAAWLRQRLTLSSGQRMQEHPPHYRL